MTTNHPDVTLLAHNYVRPEVQDAADFVGDSLELARLASRTATPYIVVAGVDFMAETAAILSPTKTVLLPAADACCPMAEMVTPEDVRRLKAEHPDAVVMCYVNSSAAVKAECDICCTSSSALRIARSLDAEEIIFVPDMHLGEYTAEKVPEKKFIFHTGFCPTHHRITEADVLAAKKAHPDATFAVHPECRADVIKHADFVGSTSEIIKYAGETEAGEVLIGTEMEIAARLQRAHPDKKFYSITSAFVCPNMKKVTLDAVLNCLENEEHEINIDKGEADAARLTLDKMVKC